MNSATNLLGYSIKPPFMIDPGKFGVFATASPGNVNCVWILVSALRLKKSLRMNQLSYSWTVQLLK